MNINELLQYAVEKKCSDLHITIGLPPMVRLNGKIQPVVGYDAITEEESKALAESILDDTKSEMLQSKGDADFALQIEGLGRFRVNVFKQQKQYAMALRVLADTIPTAQQLGIPQSVVELADKPRGLVLVTGPTGSGKSTTLAALVDHINQSRHCHILTIEDPIEYIHQHKQSIVNQREVGEDTESFARALRSALREDPDVILLGEMRDLETIQAAVTAAETGHLVFATLHTIGAANTVDRIIDVFPGEQQGQIRAQLANILEGVVTQTLVPKADGSGRIAAVEIMLMNDAIRNMIREEKVHQINSTLQTSVRQGMQPLDYHLAQLVRSNEILVEEALKRAIDQNNMRRYLSFN